ncbi:hypothetical protein BKA70DRAFT_1119274, partial [Coprinopsis sp. MPI-PUGE-AT-0042]
DCLPIFNEVFARHIREKTLPSESELVQLLRRFAEALAEMFYFLDALDEAPPDVQFDLLKRLSTLDVKVFITSRPIANLDSCFPGAHRFSIRAQDRDIELHIAKEIERSPVLQTILNQAGPSLRDNITSTIKEKCEGIFLHASLQLDALRGCANIYAVEKTLEDFPRQIEDVYQQTWKRIEAQAPETAVIAKNALTWVLCAMRSLEIEELRYAVATCPDTHKLDRRRLVDKATLMALCRGLVNVEEVTNIVRFVHYTAKDVVKSLASESSPYPHSLPASVCMTLLTERGFQQKAPADESSLKAALKAESFLAYAYKHWSIHAHKSLGDTSLVDRLSQFLQGCCAFPVGLSNQLLPSIDDVLEPLHMAAYFDFPLSVVGSEHLRNPKSSDTSQGTNTSNACHPGKLFQRNERASIIRNNCNVNATSSYGWTALMSASSEEIATLLLAHPKIQPNQVDSGGGTVLMQASSRGSLGVVKALLADPRVKVNLKSRDGMTALDMAVQGLFFRYNSLLDKRRCEEVAELLRPHSEHEYRQLHPLKALLRCALPSSRKK